MTGIISKFVLFVTVAGSGGTAIGIPFSSSSKSSLINTETALKNSKSSIDSQSSNRGITASSDSWDSLSHADPSTELKDETQTIFNSDSLHFASASLSDTQADLVLKEAALEKTVQQVETGNCKIIGSLKDILSVEGQKEANYYSIFCEDIGENEEIDIPNTFKGAFPKAVFKEKNWDESKKLEIRVTVDFGGTFSEFDTGEEDEEYTNGITFSSKEFIETNNSLLIGQWKYHEFSFGDEESEREGAIVKLTHPEINEKIYLDWEDYR